MSEKKKFCLVKSQIATNILKFAIPNLLVEEKSEYKLLEYIGKSIKYKSNSKIFEDIVNDETFKITLIGIIRYLEFNNNFSWWII